VVYGALQIPTESLGVITQGADEGCTKIIVGASRCVMSVTKKIHPFPPPHGPSSFLQVKRTQG